MQWPNNVFGMGPVLYERLLCLFLPLMDIIKAYSFILYPVIFCLFQESVRQFNLV